MSPDPSARFLWFAGGAALLATLVRMLCERLRLPAQVGYVALGLGIRLAQEEWRLFDEGTLLGLDHLAELGVVCLLFHVGLRSNPKALAEQLPKAAVVWISDVLVSAGLGYVASRWVLGMELVPSLFVAAALSATSVGVSLLSWEEADALRTRPGGFLLDLAELDDLSAVLLLVLLLGAVPALSGQGGADWAGVFGATATTLLWLGIIGLGTFLFSRYGEVHVTRFFQRRGGVAARQVVVLGAVW